MVVEIDFTNGTGESNFDIEEDDSTVVPNADAVNFDAFFDVSDDGDSTVTVSLDESEVSHDNISDVSSDDHHNRYSDDEARGASLFDANRWNPPTASLDDTEVLRTTVLVPDTKTLNVYKWGAYRLSDGTAPTGIDVELVDAPGGTVQASANTVNQEDESTAQASYQNTSGSEQVYVLRINNTTGSTYSVDTEGFVYRVE